MMSPTDCGKWIIYWRSSPAHRWRLGQALGVGTSRAQAEAHAGTLQAKLRLRRKGRSRVSPAAQARASRTIL